MRVVFTLTVAMVFAMASATAVAQPKKLFPGLPMPSDEAPAEAGAIKILDARYGKDETTCRAADSISRSCDGRASCSVVADDNLCGNPYTNVQKTLMIAYQCQADERRTVAVEQGNRADVYCGGAGSRHGDEQVDSPLTGGNSPPRGWTRNRIYVTSGIYGIRGYTCDATEYFRNQCDSKQTCSISVTNSMCGDPASGERKGGYFQWWCNGEQADAELREGQTTTLSCP